MTDAELDQIEQELNALVSLMKRLHPKKPYESKARYKYRIDQLVIKATL